MSILERKKSDLQNFIVDQFKRKEGSPQLMTPSNPAFRIRLQSIQKSLKKLRSRKSQNEVEKLDLPDTSIFELENSEKGNSNQSNTFKIKQQFNQDLNIQTNQNNNKKILLKDYQQQQNISSINIVKKQTIRIENKYLNNSVDLYKETKLALRKKIMHNINQTNQITGLKGKIEKLEKVVAEKSQRNKELELANEILQTRLQELESAHIIRSPPQCQTQNMGSIFSKNIGNKNQTSKIIPLEQINQDCYEAYNLEKYKIHIIETQKEIDKHKSKQTCQMVDVTVKFLEKSKEISLSEKSDIIQHLQLVIETYQNQIKQIFDLQDYFLTEYLDLSEDDRDSFKSGENVKIEKENRDRFQEETLDFQNLSTINDIQMQEQEVLIAQLRTREISQLKIFKELISEMAKGIENLGISITQQAVDDIPIHEKILALFTTLAKKLSQERDRHDMNLKIQQNRHQEILKTKNIQLLKLLMVKSRKKIEESRVENPKDQKLKESLLARIAELSQEKTALYKTNLSQTEKIHFLTDQNLKILEACNLKQTKREEFQYQLAENMELVKNLERQLERQSSHSNLQISQQVLQIEQLKCSIQNITQQKDFLKESQKSIDRLNADLRKQILNQEGELKNLKRKIQKLVEDLNIKNIQLKKFQTQLSDEKSENQEKEKELKFVLNQLQIYEGKIKGENLAENSPKKSKNLMIMEHLQKSSANKDHLKIDNDRYQKLALAFENTKLYVEKVKRKYKRLQTELRNSKNFIKELRAKNATKNQEISTISGKSSLDQTISDNPQWQISDIGKLQLKMSKEDQENLQEKYLVQGKELDRLKMDILLCEKENRTLKQELSRFRGQEQNSAPQNRNNQLQIMPQKKNRFLSGTIKYSSTVCREPDTSKMARSNMKGTIRRQIEFLPNQQKPEIAPFEQMINQIVCEDDIFQLPLEAQRPPSPVEFSPISPDKSTVGRNERKQQMTPLQKGEKFIEQSHVYLESYTQM